MTVREVIRIMESHGWRQTANHEQCRQFQHESRPETITLSGRLDLDVPTSVLRSLWRFTRIEETT